MNILDELRSRGILKQISNEEKFLALPEGAGVYCGFDPTATSLHLGNYIQIANLLRFKEKGFNAFAILGGATGMIGDPSFKDSERQLLDDETVKENKSKIRKQLESFGLTVIDNYDFYKDMNVLMFLRDVGKLVNISYMLAKDSVASRIQNGLSFTEFTYQLIQGWDFLSLYKNNGVRVQFGGSDQWGNITTGLDMISTVIGNEHQAVAITADLLTDSNGNKFGKSTGGGSLWLDKYKTTPYQMYQFLLNQPDNEIEKLLKWLTFIEVDEINEIIKQHNENPAARYAQKRLAKQIIKQVHSERDAEQAKLISNILFNKKFDVTTVSYTEIAEIQNDLPSIEITEKENIITTLIEQKIIKSKREAREFIEKGALKWNLQPINEETTAVSALFNGKFALLNIGKKTFYLAKIK
ncbi:tyrosine--tRNA ligase [Mycoplasma sp. Pen4]|uniref:tyrosine--tRNA ligase n=1 Tax=Mycoplasma sp. Pen4 TaxID=640330 RepID=UPI001654AC43|nr:tyrosine--tRNA ligase [Mycoplasma sp. Pen4]QNM93951.1 tyrosine--tRNA ligase [Mycoplasma sp. Pen4]